MRIAARHGITVIYLGQTQVCAYRVAKGAIMIARPDGTVVETTSSESALTTIARFVVEAGPGKGSKHRKPLRTAPSRGRIHSNPGGVSFEMTDEHLKPVRVFVTLEALHHELDDNAGPIDQFHGLKIFKKHRQRIEEAAIQKFDAVGIEDVLDGQPALFIRSTDLCTRR